MRHHKQNARNQFWSVKAIARRNRWKAEARLPESVALPMTKRLTAGLKPGDVAVVGWTAAAPTEPAWLTALLARNKAKAAKRDRYERRFKRRNDSAGESR